jgi:hypothetical protein
MDQLKQIWQSDTEDQQSITYTVKVLNVGDVEDPDIYVGQHIWEWQNSDEGKWIMEHSRPLPSWHRSVDRIQYGYKYDIKAYLTPKQITYFKLKFE